jgi:hypothetical protein
MKEFLKDKLGKHEMISALEIRNALPRDGAVASCPRGALPTRRPKNAVLKNDFLKSIRGPDSFPAPPRACIAANASILLEATIFWDASLPTALDECSDASTPVQFNRLRPLGY